MASKSLKLIESHRQGAEIYHGADICKQKFEEILCRFHIPKAIIPLNDLLEEMGYNPTTGFIWLIYSDSFEFYQPAMKKTGKYDKEFTAFIEDRRVKKMSGIKSKDFISISMSSITVDDESVNPPQVALCAFGLSKRFPVAWFETAET